MLYEISPVRQSNRSLVKRWFTDQDMDLFIWYHKNTPIKFQLSYDKRRDEQMISWDFHQGFQHYRVDSGEDYPDKYKRTPILIDERKQQNLSTLARDFLVASENIDIGVTDFIYARLMAFPVLQLQHDAVHTNHYSAP